MKKILIIGASSGLGYQMAADFARVGCRVGIAARRTEPLQTIKDLYPDRVATAEIDVTAPDAVKRFYDLIELIDGMDILVFAAGAGFQDPQLDDAKTRRILDTNVTGFARILNAAYKYFRDTASLIIRFLKYCPVCFPNRYLFLSTVEAHCFTSCKYLCTGQTSILFRRIDNQFFSL